MSGLHTCVKINVLLPCTLLTPSTLPGFKQAQLAGHLAATAMLATAELGESSLRVANSLEMARAGMSRCILHNRILGYSKQAAGIVQMQAHICCNLLIVSCESALNLLDSTSRPSKAKGSACFSN